MVEIESADFETNTSFWSK